MNGVAVEISRKAGEIPRNRRLASTVEEALDRFCRATWPIKPAVMAAREWGLTRDEAREVLRGRASRAVINKIARHRAGGLDVMIPLFEQVCGQTLAEFNAERRAEGFRRVDEANDYHFRPGGRA